MARKVGVIGGSVLKLCDGGVVRHTDNISCGKAQGETQGFGTLVKRPSRVAWIVNPSRPLKLEISENP